MRDPLVQWTTDGLLTEAAAQRVRAAIADGKPLDDAMLASSGLAEIDVLRIIGEEFGVPLADLEAQRPPREFVAKFPARVLLQHRYLPLAEQNGRFLIATSRLSDTSGFDELRVIMHKPCIPTLAPSEEIERHLKAILGVGADTMQSLVTESGQEVELLSHQGDEDLDLAEAAEDASIIKFVNQVIAEAIELRATDVHFEPFEKHFRVRYRVDGVLIEASIPAEVGRFQAAITSRLKILSHLDIAEKRLPQDGRIKLKVAGREVDIRVSVIPMLHGEAVVLRILDRGATLLGLVHLGMAPRDHAHFDRVLELPHGIVLVTGPTGSGKTTTLYAALSCINDVERKIITIEDPIEYHLTGINQIQISTKTGMTFARGLRAILRHDPDVVLIGEIRDRETAEIAVQASLTGHMVFSTLHTNDAPGALTRLVDMGIEPYLVASSLEMVVAQRLVRLICKHCREAVPPSDAEMEALRNELGDAAPSVVHIGKGCRECRGTGFRGRSGIFETMPITEEIRSLILTRAPAGDIRKVALRQGMRSLREDGLRLMLEGRTTLEEVLRVTKDEMANDAAATASEAADAAADAVAAKASQAAADLKRRVAKAGA